MSYTTCKKCGRMCLDREQPCYPCQLETAEDNKETMQRFADATQKLRQAVDKLFGGDPPLKTDQDGRVLPPPGPGRSRERRKGNKTMRGNNFTPKKKKRK